MSTETDHSKKATMSDKERLELAAKLDADLDQFIDGLEKKRYTEGWPEDRWEEEMDKHPFFMKKPPEIGDDLHPMLEGLQQLKYDPMENTTEDLAATYKEDGNFYLKHKKYNMAIYSYSEGIKLKCQNEELNSILYNNRSAAHFFLKNYRSSLVDAKKALTINPTYLKALWRSAQCYSLLQKFDECIDFCYQILHIDPKHELAIALRKTTQNQNVAKARDERKQLAVMKKKSENVLKTIAALEARKIRFENHKNQDGDITEELIRPYIAPLEDFPVHLDEDGSLIWPTAFCYPEFEISEFQQNLSENTTMANVLAEMFSEPLGCDTEHKYIPGKLNVYYENRLSATVHKCNLEDTIAKIVTNPNFRVTGGCITFFVVPKDSDAEQEYITKERHPVR